MSTRISLSVTSDDPATVARATEHCGDAAGWPNPRQGLADGDELGDFIAEYRRLQESA